MWEEFLPGLSDVIAFFSKEEEERKGKGMGENEEKKQERKGNIGRKQKKSRLFQEILQKLGLTRWRSVKRNRSGRTTREQYLPDTAGQSHT